MPRPRPPEFRRRAVELARLREKPIAQIAADLGISDSCLRNWLRQADVDEGRKEGLSTDERAELVLRVPRMSSTPVTRYYSALVAPTTMWEIETNSV